MDDEIITKSFSTEKYVQIIMGRGNKYDYETYVYDVYGKTWYREEIDEELLYNGNRFEITRSLKMMMIKKLMDGKID